MDEPIKIGKRAQFIQSVERMIAGDSFVVFRRKIH
jgi:hypothetical protein